METEQALCFCVAFIKAFVTATEMKPGHHFLASVLCVLFLFSEAGLLSLCTLGWLRDPPAFSLPRAEIKGCAAATAPSSICVLLFFFSLFKLFYVYECFACVYGTYGGQKEGVGSPRIGITNGCELSCGCWESNPGPLGEQLMPLTPEPSLQSLS